MPRKTLTLILASVIVLSLTLTACGPPPVDVSGTSIQFWHVYGEGDPRNEAVLAFVDDFNATNEYDITVEALDQGQHSDLEDKINAGIQSGDLPHVTQAYTSGHVCSPTRAGLMLGRYQQRVGVYSAGDGGRGFDPKLPIFPSFLPKAYVKTAIGKWHLGLDEDYPELKWHAMNRGFDECYKFMGRGAHDYYQLKGASGTHDTGPIYRNKERIDDEGYLTQRLSEEAVRFIKRHSARPFFLYLAYNAVHAPKQAPAEDIARFRKQFPNIRVVKQH